MDDFRAKYYVIGGIAHIYDSTTQQNMVCGVKYRRKTVPWLHTRSVIESRNASVRRLSIGKVYKFCEECEEEAEVNDGALFKWN